MMKLVIYIALLATVFADVSHILRPLNQLSSPFASLPKLQPIRVQPLVRVQPVVRVQPIVRPQPLSPGQEIPILRQEQDISPEGSYRWAYETGNGISAEESAQVKQLGPEQVAKSAQGAFAWTSPEGEPIQISYVADENGYQPVGAAIPQPPPIPEAIQRSLAWIAAHPSQPDRRF